MTKEELENAIKEADEMYYANGTSPYSDLQYDNMKESLRKLDPDSPVLQSLGTDHVDGFRKIKHERRMLSLEKVHEVAGEESDNKFRDLRDWLSKFAVEGQEDELTDDFSVEPKIDGMSAEALYVNGRLIHVSTRGNGDEGDDITENVRHLFPETVQTYSDSADSDLSNRFLVRGELYISKSEFARINKEQAEANQELFKNARNLCAGTVKSKDGLQGRTVSFIVHGYIDLEGIDSPSDAAITDLKTSGLETVFKYTFGPHYSMSSLCADVERINKERDEYPFVIDGAVVKIDDDARRAELGETDHHPRWAVAYKYPPEQKKTTVKAITWQIGAKTGKAVPVAEVEPVILDGTEVSRASLANAGQMAARGIAPGVEVMICKSGEIIPFVTKVINPAEVTLNPTMPCPSCGKDMRLVLGQADNTADYICDNPNCPERAIASLVTALGKSGLNVIGFGKEVAAEFMRAPHLQEVWRRSSKTDNLLIIVYILHKESYPAMFSGKSGDNLTAELEKARKAPLHRWIAALQFPGVAIGTARKISQVCKDWKDFVRRVESRELDITAKQMLGIRGEWNATMACIDALLTTINVDFNPVSDNYVDPDAKVEGKLEGKAFVVTGKFRTGRGAIEAMIPANGGVLRSSVSKKTDYLVAGEDVGATKTRKAEACGTKVITEDEFLQMLK